jgi:hypothetical protein
MNNVKKETMKKFALIIASLICFAGCARNETDTGTASSGVADTNTALGTPATSQSGRDASMSLRTNQSSSIMTDTNLTPQPTQPQPLPPAQTDTSSSQPSPNGQSPNNNQSNSDASRSSGAAQPNNSGQLPPQ